jgi:hypothetical protein
MWAGNKPMIAKDETDSEPDSPRFPNFIFM